MAVATSVNRSGIWQTLTHFYVNLSGTYTEVLEIHVNDSGTWRRVYVFAQIFEVTSGTLGFPGTIGFINGSVGSISAAPPGNYASYNVVAIFDPPSNQGTLRISGFSSNPGAAFIYRATIDSTSKLTADASYSYSSGQAEWVWPGAFGLVSSTVQILSIEAGNPF